MTSSASPERDDTWCGLHWDEIRARLRGAIRRILREREDIEDLVQTCVAELLAIPPDSVQHPRSFIHTMATNRARDEIRRRKRWQMTAVDPGTTADDPGPFGWVDPVELVRFASLAFFRKHHERCAWILERRLESEGHDDIAEEAGSTPGAIKKQWSRCVALLRDAFRSDAEMRRVAEWVHDDL